MAVTAQDRAGNPLCMLAVHAHPDDEASKGAGTVAKYTAEGIRCVLVCCTGGEAGDIQWNFEKFLLAPGGEVVNRFRPRTVPDAPEVIAAIEAVLPR